MSCNYEEQSCNSEKLPVQEIKSQLPFYYLFFLTLWWKLVKYYVAIKLKKM